MKNANIVILLDMSEKEESVFHSLLHPDDIYNEQGTYWADLPAAQRTALCTIWCDTIVCWVLVHIPSHCCPVPALVNHIIPTGRM